MSFSALTIGFIAFLGATLASFTIILLKRLRKKEKELEEMRKETKGKDEFIAVLKDSIDTKNKILNEYRDLIDGDELD